MSKQLWINLPVKDVKRAQEFFSRIGFVLNPQYQHNEGSASFLYGDPPIVIMLFEQSAFEGFARAEASNTAAGTEVLFSLGAESRAEIDHIAGLIEPAGGSLFSPPEEIGGWMYGCGFADPDGHRWNLLYMDMDKMPA